MDANEAVYYATKGFAPPPKLKISEWADERRVLSSESCAEPGKWVTASAEYQRGVMDAFCNPLVEVVVVMTSSQVGKTEILNNVVGYFIDQDPSPMLVVYPTVEMAETWSKDRLAPMLRDTPCLRGKVKDPKTRDSGNTILHKVFEGGHLTVAGSNSPASLSSRPVRIVLCDEVDRFPGSAGSEGDPVKLAFKRANNFWNRKRGMFSTPTIKGGSRIERAYENSDRGKFYVPCIHCGHFQVLRWAHVIWPMDRPAEAAYHCSHCGSKISAVEVLAMVARGEWRSEADFRGVAGFWLNEIYSSWVSQIEMACNFLEAKKDPETLRVFINTSLGETWEEAKDERKVGDEALFARREKYSKDEIPAPVVVLTAGVDVQDDRLEAGVVGWGIGEESWDIEHKIFYGDPAKQEVWGFLDKFLRKTYRHATGYSWMISCTAIDTGGHHTQQVYNFVRPLQDARCIWAIKGANQRGLPIISKPGTSVPGIDLYHIGTDTAKNRIYSNLHLTMEGPGYMHFPLEFDKEHFSQLCGEKAVTKYHAGFPYREWHKTRERNEALDIKVMQMAALHILQTRKHPNKTVPQMLELLSQSNSFIIRKIEKNIPIPDGVGRSGGRRLLSKVDIYEDKQ